RGLRRLRRVARRFGERGLRGGAGGGPPRSGPPLSALGTRRQGFAGDEGMATKEELARVSVAEQLPRLVVGGPAVVLHLLPSRDDMGIVHPADEVDDLLEDETLCAPVDVADRLPIAGQEFHVRNARLLAKLTQRRLDLPLALFHTAFRKLPMLSFGHRRGDDQVKNLAVLFPEGDDATGLFSKHEEPPVP